MTARQIVAGDVANFAITLGGIPGAEKALNFAKQSASANGGNFNFNNATSANPFGSRVNELFNIGYNVNSNGQPLNTNDDAAGWAVESHYAPDSTHAYLEWHQRFTFRDGTEIRWLTANVEKQDSVSSPKLTSVSMFLDTFNVQNRAAKVLFTVDGTNNATQVSDNYLKIIRSVNTLGPSLFMQLDQEIATTDLNIAFQYQGANKFWFMSKFSAGAAGNFWFYNQTFNGRTWIVDATTNYFGVGDNQTAARQLHVYNKTATVNGIDFAARFQNRHTTGTPAVGMGTGFELYTPDAGGTDRNVATFEFPLTVATAAAASADAVVKLMSAGTLAERFRIKATGDGIVIPTAKTPASAAATGTAGQWSWDASFMYVCTATDTWKRAAIATW